MMRTKQIMMRVLRRTGFVLAALMALPLVAGVTGLTWDVLGQLWILPLGIHSMHYFRNPENVTYRKLSFNTDMTEGNAWGEYSRIVSALENRDRMSSLLLYFGQGKQQDTAQAAVELVEYDSIVSLMKEGVHREVCAIPIDYHQGVDAQHEHWAPLNRAATLLSVRADVNISKNADSALEDLVDGLVFWEDIAGGQLTIDGHQRGIVGQHRFTRRIWGALTEFRFSKPQLKVLACAMNSLADNEPSPLRSLDAYPRLAAISLAKLPFFGTFLHKPHYMPSGYETFQGWWFSHFLSYRHLFSFRLSQLSGIRMQRKMVRQLTLAEAGGWSALDSVLNHWSTRVQKDPWNLDHLQFLADFYFPGTFLCQRHYGSVAKMRVAGTAALVELYFLENEHWPDELALAKTNGLEDLLIDPFTDRHLKCIVYPGEDSVAIYSVGPNMIDDGGIKDKEKDDLQLVLHRPTRSQ